MCILSGYWLSPSIKHHLCTILELWGHRGMCDHKVKWMVLKKVENKETCNSFSVLLISSIAHYACVRTAELSRKKKKKKGTASTFLHSNVDSKCTCNTVQTDYSNSDFGDFVDYKYVLPWNYKLLSMQKNFVWQQVHLHMKYFRVGS